MRKRINVSVHMSVCVCVVKVTKIFSVPTSTAVRMLSVGIEPHVHRYFRFYNTVRGGGGRGGNCCGHDQNKYDDTVIFRKNLEGLLLVTAWANCKATVLIPPNCARKQTHYSKH